jgi:hypothetical protein
MMTRIFRLHDKLEIFAGQDRRHAILEAATISEIDAGATALARTV